MWSQVENFYSAWQSEHWQSIAMLKMGIPLVKLGRRQLTDFLPEFLRKRLEKKQQTVEFQDAQFWAFWGRYGVRPDIDNE